MNRSDWLLFHRDDWQSLRRRVGLKTFALQPNGDGSNRTSATKHDASSVKTPSKKLSEKSPVATVGPPRPLVVSKALKEFGQRLSYAVAVCTLASSAQAHKLIDTSAFPELAPEAMLSAVVASLKHSLNDPHSIQDFTICRPYKLGLKDGRPHTWAIMLSFNVKNGNGGYEGMTRYAAAFKDGRVDGDISKAQMETNVGLDRIINNAIAKDMVSCVNVPDAEIQQRLQVAH